MASLSFIEVVDTVSPLVTLGFGIYCAMNETKPENGKLSRAGKVALWGLIISGLITQLVKVDELLQEKQAEVEKTKLAKIANNEKDSVIAQQRREAIKKAFDDSVRLVFQKTTSDSLSKSISELNKIKFASNTTLHSLDIVNEKQQASILQSKRGLHPLFPLKTTLEYKIDINEFFKKNPSESNFKYALLTYLDTLIHFASQPKIIEDRYKRIGRNDTVYISKARFVDPFENTLPERIQEQFKDVKYRFLHYFLIKNFNIHFRERNNKIELDNNQIDMAFNLEQSGEEISRGKAGGYIKSSVDRNMMMLSVSMLLNNPTITSKGFKDGFISLYDLQNSIIGFEPGNEPINDQSIFKLKKNLFIQDIIF